MANAVKEQCVKYGQKLGIPTVIQLAILLVAIVGGWTSFRDRIHQNEKNIAKNEVCDAAQTQEIKTISDGQAIVRSDIRAINIQQEHIVKGIDEIKEKLK